MWGGVRDEVPFYCELHKNIKIAEVNVGLDVGLKFTITAITLKINNKLRRYGGSGGIRTHGTVPRTLVFKTRALNHSATLPTCFGGVFAHSVQHSRCNHITNSQSSPDNGIIGGMRIENRGVCVTSSVSPWQSLPWRRSLAPFDDAHHGT